MKFVLQQNLLSDLHDGESCYFTKYEYLQETIDEIASKNKPCVLISGNSDYTHTQEMINSVASKVPCVKRWYAQNLNAKHEIAEALPLGITNIVECKRGEKHGVKRVDQRHVEKAKYMYDDDSEPKENIYANFNIQTNPAQRIPVANLCCDINFINQDFTGLSLDGYFAKCRNHKMIVCPQGNGFDTHRLWETLYIGRVPVTLKIDAMSHFQDLPIVWLDKWDELKDLDLLLERYETVKDYSRQRCYANYWTNRIKTEITGLFS